ncbi:unnamed protein product [Trichogramma brassicae]|uniref:Uncharacterized protein n=1 Tax=Trichogramma brassicae TaxID=86971 RepID=A0A6H5ISH3_9HYME|nr:unnamed protein product [Trichogramma brassicae]
MAAATSVVVLDRGNNTTCTINLHGATVVSWRVNNQEQLFVSHLINLLLLLLWLYDNKRVHRVAERIHTHL